MKTLLVVAAHADDEALGCGGTIARYVGKGDTVHLVLMADGVHSRTDASRADLARRIEASARARYFRNFISAFSWATGQPHG